MHRVFRDRLILEIVDKTVEMDELRAELFGDDPTMHSRVSAFKESLVRQNIESLLGLQAGLEVNIEAMKEALSQNITPRHA